MFLGYEIVSYLEYSGGQTDQVLLTVSGSSCSGKTTR